MRSNHLHSHHLVFFGDLDPSDPASRAADLPDLVFGKVDGLSHFRADKEMLFSIGQFGGDEFVPFIEVNGDDPAGSGDCCRPQGRFS